MCELSNYIWYKDPRTPSFIPVFEDIQEKRISFHRVECYDSWYSNRNPVSPVEPQPAECQTLFLLAIKGFSKLGEFVLLFFSFYFSLKYHGQQSSA